MHYGKDPSDFKKSGLERGTQESRETGQEYLKSTQVSNSERQ